jgi:hypothetical protein
MTPEQIQSALGKLEQLVSQLRLMTNHYEGELLLHHGEPQYIQDCNDSITTILTQALEIAKGDNVVVPKTVERDGRTWRLTSSTYGDITDLKFDLVFNHYGLQELLDKAMIAVAEGDKEEIR